MMHMQEIPPQGEGTTVTIAIPCVGSTSAEIKPAELSAESSPASAEQGSISLFIVEDDRMNRMVLEKMLRHVGNITLAVDGDDAMTKIEKAYKKKVLFDVMLFDMQLPPPWDGISLMQKVKELIRKHVSAPMPVLIRILLVIQSQQWMQTILCMVWAIGNSFPKPMVPPIR